MNRADKAYRVFLLADAEVLVGSDYDSALVKVAAAEYDAVEAIPNC
jgi:hypothetical protein